jgi:hypothetical protein
MLTDSDSTFLSFTDVPATEFHPHRISCRELHRYVWGLMAVFSAFVISYPIACWRVSQSEQFRPYRSHVKSLMLPVSGSNKKYDVERFPNSIFTTPATRDRASQR